MSLANAAQASQPGDSAGSEKWGWQFLCALTCSGVLIIAWYPVQVFLGFLFSWLVLFFLSRKLQDVCTEQQETECLEVG